MSDASIATVSGPATGEDACAWLLDTKDQQGLDRLRGSRALAEGKVAQVSLTAVKARLGARWRPRRETVHDYAERALIRSITTEGFFLRLSETDYLVAQPDATVLAGQSGCFNALREILTFFLGEASDADVLVHQVTSITEGAIEGHLLDVAAVETKARAERALEFFAAEAEGGTLSLAEWTPFITNDGRKVRVSCTLEPLLHLKTFARIGHRIRRRVLEVPGDTPLSPLQQSQLSRADIEKVDMATLLRGLDRLKSDGGGAKQPSLVLPVSFTSLSSIRGRSLIADVFRRARESVQTGLICEVCDIEGVPPGALLSATSLMRPFCLFVIGRLNAMPGGGLGGLEGAGLQGLSIEWPNRGMGEAEFAGEMRLLAGATRKVAKTLLVYGLESPRQAAIAGFLGATHATITAA